MRIGRALSLSLFRFKSAALALGPRTHTLRNIPHKNSVALRVVDHVDIDLPTRAGHEL